MNKDVNYFFNKINNISLDKIDYDYIYSELICNNINDINLLEESLGIY